MATLEKIRKRSTLLLIVVGLALLAFIVGDFFTSGRTLFGTGTTIAKVGGNKIDVQEFQRRYEQVNQRMQQQQNANKIDPARLQSEVLESMIQEQLLADELDALGITVTDNELSKAMLGATAHPAMYQFAQQLGAQSPDQVYDFAFNPVKYNVPAETAQQIQNMWLEQERQMEQMLKITKFQNLLAGSIVANELDAKAYYDNNATTKHVVYTPVVYGSDAYPVSKYEVTKSEIQAQYESDKHLYPITEETRRGGYVAVAIKPSSADLQEAHLLVDSMMNLLKTTPELEAVSNDANFGVDRRTATANDITNNYIRQFVTDSVVGSVKNISYIDEEFTVAKLLGKKMAVDSVNMDFVIYEGDAAGRDSVMAALQGGSSLEEVAQMNGVVDARADLWQQFASAPEGEIKDRVLNAGSGYFYLDSAETGARIARVNSKKAPVQVYDYATITYKVYPSDKTIDDLNIQLNEFAAKMTSADSLTMASAFDHGYSYEPFRVTENSYMIGNVPYSRNVVKWVMEAKPGDVSPVMETQQQDQLVLVALKDIFKKGYVPLNNEAVYPNVELRAKNKKIADDILANTKGQTMEQIAAANKSRIDTTDVTFGQMFVAGIGPSEQGLVGQISVTPAGGEMKPYVGNQAVYYYQVISDDTQGRPYSYDENAARFNQQYGTSAVMQNIMDIMVDKSTVQNNMLKFYSE
ncbi:MAG: SurA N-terminal domain-containing protein [Muribaculum sp.]|nr:SurA N-terminal domain-containing protein [Muribaculaceae bacterium]MCM1081636.1 SurA N-terminal domain-containing protein [Muribaculum sp.]